MDINGTRFHLVQHGDWSRCVASDGIDLTGGAKLQPRLLQIAAPVLTRNRQPVAERRGAARDRYGNWYWIDEARAGVVVRSVGSDALSDFWPVKEPPAPSDPGTFAPFEQPRTFEVFRLSGLAVTEDHYLIVGTTREAFAPGDEGKAAVQPGLLVFDLHAGGPPRHLVWPETAAFAPFDMASRPGGGVIILDRSNHCYWELDRQLGVVDPRLGVALEPEPFRPVTASHEELPARRLAVVAGVQIEAPSELDTSAPVAVEALPDGSVLILDQLRAKVLGQPDAGSRPRPQVHHYRSALRVASVPLVFGAADAGPTLELGADLAFGKGSGVLADRLYVPAADGQQAYAFDVAWHGVPLQLSIDKALPFLPMRLFGGKGLVSAEGLVWYDFDATSWVRLLEQRRPRFTLQGTFDTPAFDGREPGCVWHRLFFDGCLPPATGVSVWSRAADEEADLKLAQWSAEPAPIRRTMGPELALVPVLDTRPAAGTFELLFQRARGRWLQLRFELRGDGRATPSLHALRIWYPRFSYLAQYLPAVYREDAESASFLDRFLANLEGLFTSVQDKMAVAQLLIDARTAPKEALDWLASWFGVALDPAWSEAKRRLFVRHADRFFRMRGTVRGLQTALRLVIDDCVDERLFGDDVALTPASVRIVESYRLRRLPPLSLGDPRELSGIRQMSLPPPWTPELGGEALLDLYRAVFQGAGLTQPMDVFPVFEPLDGTAPLWHQFLRDTLALVGTAAAGEVGAWRAFLAARYPTLKALNAAWSTNFSSLDAVALPSALPEDGAPLFDWYQFQLSGGRFAPSGTRWIPAHGKSALSERWRQYLHGAGLAAVGDFPLAQPAEADLGKLWRAFAGDVLGFLPASAARDQAAWREFLARRYRRPAELAVAYGDPQRPFEEINLPLVLPADGLPIRDWFDFQSIALGTRQHAHRFTVLLPVPAREAFALTLHEQRRALAQRIVELEKPSHTLFDIKFYWAMFRVGEARLAIDTLLSEGSRAPELRPAAVLGSAFLAESLLTGTPPERESDRPILGTYALRSRTTPKEKTS